MDKQERKNTELIKEFNRYVREHPEFAEQIPDDAAVIMQLEDDEEFNAWARRMAQKRREQGDEAVLVRIKELKPLHSRIKHHRTSLPTGVFSPMSRHPRSSPKPQYLPSGW